MAVKLQVRSHKFLSLLNWSALSAFYPVICWFVKYSHMNSFTIPLWATARKLWWSNPFLCSMNGNKISASLGQSTIAWRRRNKMWKGCWESHMSSKIKKRYMHEHWTFFTACFYIILYLVTGILGSLKILNWNWN